jgi:hypothetical protein
MAGRHENTRPRALFLVIVRNIVATSYQHCRHVSVTMPGRES